MKITVNQLRRIIKEEVQKTMDEMGAPRAKRPRASSGKVLNPKVQDPEGLRDAMQDYGYYGRRYILASGNPNMVLVIDPEKPDYYTPFVYARRKWDISDGPVDETGKPIIFGGSA